MYSDVEQELEDAREQYFWRRVVHALLALLIALALAAVLWILTIVFEWQRHFLLSVLGLLAGILIAVALGASRRDRALVGLVVGGITLPSLAAYLVGSAARSPEAFSATSAGLFPFLVHGSVAVIGAVCIADLWRRRPSPPPMAATRAPELDHGKGAAP